MIKKTFALLIGFCFLAAPAIAAPKLNDLFSKGWNSPAAEFLALTLAKQPELTDADLQKILSSQLIVDIATDPNSGYEALINAFDGDFTRAMFAGVKVSLGLIELTGQFDNIKKLAEIQTGQPLPEYLLKLRPTPNELTAIKKHQTNLLAKFPILNKI